LRTSAQKGIKKSLTLFESESQYREKATIWRVFSLLPLYGALARGRIWRWFAINIPMDLETGGRFTSDIDILARLSDFPRFSELDLQNLGSQSESTLQRRISPFAQIW